MLGGLPVEMITMLGSSLLGGVMSMWSQATKNKQEQQKMLLARDKFQMAEDEEFYLGLQLTRAQKDYLVSVGQPPEANNKIRPAVEQVLSNVAGASPEWDVRPTGKTDSEVAFVYNKLLDKIWYESANSHNIFTIPSKVRCSHSLTCITSFLSDVKIT